eukprot:Cvel_28555.t1-p1 / transcript=Cvel_28555.t1 / gene=Cvel_28555 / organism=Chromera_velia_CCMP2878 / gene_product=hypothetical protein / transcript_product=hypothetical protein / location=Cvel_scaffold3760:12890-13492(+) / protein_length=201 / sequence_SO=supercontig / SO=protein_coding / is_pseudo=false
MLKRQSLAFSAIGAVHAPDTTQLHRCWLPLMNGNVPPGEFLSFYPSPHPLRDPTYTQTGDETVIHANAQMGDQTHANAQTGDETHANAQMGDQTHANTQHQQTTAVPPFLFIASPMVNSEMPPQLQYPQPPISPRGVGASAASGTAGGEGTVTSALAGASPRFPFHQPSPSPSAFQSTMQNAMTQQQLQPPVLESSDLERQ